MNGSSAYSNVLLTPAVTSSSPLKNPAPGNDAVTNDASSFRQNFDDAHAQMPARASNDKPEAKRKLENQAAQPPARKELKKADASGQKSDAVETKSLRASKKVAADDKVLDAQVTTAPVAQSDPSPVSSLLNKLLNGTCAESPVTENANESPVAEAGELDLSSVTNALTDGLTNAAVGETSKASQIVTDGKSDVAKVKDTTTNDISVLTSMLPSRTDLAGTASVLPTEGSALDTADQGVTLMATSGLAVDNKPAATAIDKPADELTALLTPTEADEQAITGLKSLVAETKAEKPLTQVNNLAGQAADSNPEKSNFEKLFQTLAKSVMSESVPAASTGTTDSVTTSASANSAVSGFEALSRGLDSQSPATRGFVVQTAVPVPVGQPQWSEAVGEKVLWLAAQNVTAAEIHLHPKDLGPMQVNVTVNQDQANVTFTSHHPVVREVLDQNLNRLRDMFTEQGLNLVNVDVSDKSFQRQQGDGKQQQGQGDGQASSDEPAAAAVSVIKQDRLVDHYA